MSVSCERRCACRTPTRRPSRRWVRARSMPARPCVGALSRRPCGSRCGGPGRIDAVLARVGRWCFRRRWWVLAGWLAAVTAGVFAAGPVFSGLANDDRIDDIEAAQAYDQISEANETGGEVVAIVDGVQPRSDAVRGVVVAAAGSLAGRPDVQAVAHPYAADPRAVALF